VQIVGSYDLLSWFASGRMRFKRQHLFTGDQFPSSYLDDLQTPLRN